MSTSAVQAPEPRVILASQSRFRAAMLAGAGVAAEAMPAHVDEAEVKAAAQAEGRSAADAALLLASLKAERIARRHPDALVIGGDQILVCEDAWFDKPPDLDTARAHLRRLRGRTHRLETAILCQRGGQRVWQHVARPELTMRNFSDAFLERYLALEGEVLTTTVGAYRIEGPGAQLFSRVSGEHAAIMGLPLLPLLAFLRQHRVLMD